MRKLYLFAAMAAMLASCSSDDLTKESAVAQQNDGQAIMFDSYVNRSTTRSGEIGDQTTTTLKVAWDQSDSDNKKFGGFGVFGYYTNNNDYDQMATPNFMYNQLVTWHSSNEYWRYSPVKYWPNEYGTNAISDDADRVSFFAYAPYVEVIPASGKPTTNNRGDAETGITQLSRNTVSGDPIVKYVASFDYQKAVDLCWGVCETNTWTKVNDGKQQEFTFGKPWLDVQRPSDPTKLDYNTGQKVKFNFKHATAKMQVNIDAFVDGTDNTLALDPKTRIFIRSIRFNGFAMKGALNLNNETPYQPYWLNYNGVGDLEADGDIVVYDGRRDGKEGMSNADASNEKSLGLNKNFIQTENLVETGAWKDADPTPATFVPSGVTKDTKVLFDNGGIFYVIPVSGETVQIEIVYDVETIDPNLANTISDGRTAGSSVENHITKDITFGNARNNSLEAGKAYTINLHLGMNSVKFDAEVVDWDAILPATDVDLPANMPVVATSSTANHKETIEIPGHVNGVSYTYYFAASGFVGGENITTTKAASNPIFTAAETNSTGKFTGTGDNKANTSGVAYVKATVAPYLKVVNSTGADDIKLVGASGQNVQLTVKQLAVKLGLAAPETPAAGKTLLLRRNITGTADTWTDATTGCGELAGYVGPTYPTNNYIRVWVNGAELVYNASATKDNEFSFAHATGTITFIKDLKVGDIIKVTIKCGDVAEETISFNI
jgi:hypothetical protein